MANLYQQKIDTMNKVMNHVDVGRVPILSPAQTWAISYAGKTAQECKEDPHIECEIYGKYMQDMYFDGTPIFGISRPLNATNGLGFDPYFISHDGVTLQCASELEIINDDEIDRFLANPNDFFRQVALPRRFPALQQDAPETAKLLVNSIKAMMEFTGREKIKIKYLKKHVGTPMVCGSLPVFSPLEQWVMYRGYTKGLGDLRRRPEKVLEACEKLLPIVSAQKGKHKPFPWLYNPIVIATYLNPKQFEKFFWPFYKRMCMEYINDGGKILAHLEGKWGDKVEYFNEFPANTVAVLLEGDDFDEVYSKIGQKVAVGYPFPGHLLRDGTPEQVRAEAKRIIDKIGTKGVFLTAEKCLLSPSDAKPENLAALCEVSRDYRP